MSALNAFGSFEKAVELIKEPNSGCILETTKRHIALSPKYIGRVRSGVGEILDAELGRFSKCLCGVLLAYGNIKLLQPSGDILDDNPFIHFDIKFDAVVFKPAIGSLLKCVVNEQASDHVGCLVHNWFNLSLLASRKELNGKRQLRLEPGYSVLVQVERLHAKNGMLAIEARAPDDRSELILENDSFQNDTDSESNLVSSQQPPTPDPSDAPDSSALMPGEETKKSAKKKKRKHSIVKEEETVGSQHLTEAGDCGKTTSPKTSRKKSHTEDASQCDDSFSLSGVAGSKTGEETSPRKKRKKQKHVKVEFTDSTLDPVVHETVTETTWEETSSKKKKKKKDRQEPTNLDTLQSCVKVEQEDVNIPGSSKNRRQVDEQSPDMEFTKLKKKKRKDKENSLASNVSEQQQFADNKLSTEDRTRPVKIKKEKLEHNEVNGKHSGSGNKVSIKSEPDCESGHYDVSEHTRGCETIVESHKKHKRKVKDRSMLDGSLVNGSGKKKKKKKD